MYHKGRGLPPTFLSRGAIMAEVKEKKEVKKIESLTPEQEAQLKVYHDLGLKWGLDCSPADRPKAEAAIKRVYANAGLEEPVFYWCNNQHEALKLYHEQAKADGEDPGDQSLPSPFSGQHEASWVAWWRFYQDVLGVEIDPKAHDWEDITMSCGWWYAFSGAVICLEKYEEIHLDAQNRLHREDGFAVKYRNDSGGEFFWHGQNVPAKVIMAPETLTVDEISKETNAEVQRIMVERYGPGKYMQDSGSQLIDADGGLGKMGSAPRALYQDKTGQKWLVGTDGSTARVYYMAVPPEVNTCQEAHQAIGGMEDETKCQFEC